MSWKLFVVKRDSVADYLFYQSAPHKCVSEDGNFVFKSDYGWYRAHIVPNSYYIYEDVMPEDWWDTHADKISRI